MFEQKDYEDGPQILESEVRWALNALANKKSPGSDSIPTELLKYGGEGTVKAITQLCQEIWKTKDWPKYWKHSVYLPFTNERRLLSF